MRGDTREGDMIDGWPLKVSCGVGVNSVAMLIGMRQINLVPDAILFADTGSEMPGTYAYVPTLQAWLASVGFPPMVTVRRVAPKTGDLSLFAEVWRLGILPSIAYGFQRHSCAIKWKATPQEKWCRAWPLAQVAWSQGRKVWVGVGFDSGGGDCKRYFKATKQEEKKPNKRFAYWYPLQQWGWDRAACERVIVREGLPVPPKSSCFMCSSRTKPEIIQLGQQQPELLLQALALEDRALPKLRRIKGLGCKFRWRDVWEQHLRASS
jgi:hypothetical protein